MKTLKLFTKWFTKTGKDDKTHKTTYHSDYSPGRDRINGGEWIAEIRKREAAEKKRKERWRKEFKQKMNNNYTPIFNSTQNYNPSNYTYANNSITTTNLADSAITINGGPNGSMKVDVPLVVNGRDVMKEIDEMRDALLLLKRDVDMESKYPKLKELKDAYERQLEKYKTWEALK
jgi:hypothetical protein